MYVLDYKTKKIKKFTTSSELSNFLNKIVKKKYIFLKDKKTATKFLKKVA